MGLLDGQTPPQGGLLSAALANRDATNASGNSAIGSLLGQYIDWQKNRDFGAELTQIARDPMTALNFMGAIRAYHGSPHSFSKFDMSKIGTGEGAQAYGHGLYFAENPEVAQSYRDALTRAISGVHVDGAPIESAGISLGAQNLAKMHSEGFQTIDQAAANAQRTLENATAMLKQYPSSQVGAMNKDTAQSILSAVDELRGKDISFAPHKGSMYEVDIHADPQSLLDWDKPLAQQSPQAQSILGGRFGYEPTDTGGAIYKSLAEGGEPSEISGILNEGGVPGIRYLDGGSRGAGTGTSNFVVFNPSLVEILRKYGIAAPVATGAVAGAQSGSGGQ